MNLKKLMMMGIITLTTVAFTSQESFALSLFSKKTGNKIIQLKGSDTILNLSSTKSFNLIKG